MMIGPEQGKKPAKAGKKKDKAKKAKRQADAADPGTPSTAAATEPVARDRRDGAGEPPASAVPPAFGPPLLAWIDRVQERIDHLLTLTDLSAPTAAEGSELDLPSATESAPAAAGLATPPATESTPAPPAESAPAPAGDGLATPTGPEIAEDEAHRLSLAEAWARRLEAEGEEAAGADDERDASVAASNDGSAADPEAPTVEEAHEPAADPDVATPSTDGADDSTHDEPTPDEHDDEPFEPVVARLSAVLVARELIARGVTPTDVRRRLRDGYGVDDPDAVLSRVVAA